MKTFLTAIMLAATCLFIYGCGASNATSPIQDSADNNSSSASDTTDKTDSSNDATTSDDTGSVAVNDGQPAADDSKVQTSETKTDNDATDDESTNQSTAPKDDANSEPDGDDKIHDISFIDLQCGLQENVRFREFMLKERPKDLIGKRVRISGNMFAGVEQIRNITEFILLKNKDCKYGPGGLADHLIFVELKEGLTTSFRRNTTVYEVVGRLKLNPEIGEAGFTYSIYDLECESVKIR